MDPICWLHLRRSRWPRQALEPAEVAMPVDVLGGSVWRTGHVTYHMLHATQVQVPSAVPSLMPILVHEVIAPATFQIIRMAEWVRAALGSTRLR